MLLLLLLLLLLLCIRENMVLVSSLETLSTSIRISSSPANGQSSPPAGLHGRADCDWVQLRGQRGVDGGPQQQRQPHGRAVVGADTSWLRLPGGQLRGVSRRAHQLLPL